MIVRRWTGAVLSEHAEEYLALMRDVAIPDYRAISGNCGALCLHAERGNIVEITMLTFWTGMAAIHAFAGTNPMIAKYYEFDPAFLLWQEPEVEHTQVAAAACDKDFGNLARAA